MKILFAASEAYPFSMSGGLADVAGALPKALRRRLVGCRVILPLYGNVSEELRAKMNFITNITVPVAWRRQYCGIFEARVDGVIYYLIDNQYYFNRNALYGFYDDAERYAFFSRAVLEVLPVIDFKPDIIHCNDWQTALIPVYLNCFYRDSEFFRDMHTVFTVHNIQYQGKYGHELTGDVLGIPQDKEHIIDYDNCVNFMKGALQESDRITTVSPTYAKEILDPYYSHGLDGILRDLGGKISGIVNGIDYDVYSPETDPSIYVNYGIDTIDKKQENKKALLREMGLPEGGGAVIGIVSRLVKHKGLDLVKCVFEELVKANVYFVILGSGEWEFETFFHEMAGKYPEKVAFKHGFHPDTAHKIYAGADLFLMPSQSEPCGLSQLIALRYGTVPIVRETGGLNDTIRDCSLGDGNGFTFKNYNAHEMEDAVWRAIGMYEHRPDDFAALRKYTMSCDNSWARSAGEYIRLYKSILGK